MSNAKQHHYVPRFYLEGFTDVSSGTLWAYHLGKEVRASAPEKEARINYFYSHEEEGKRRFVAEEALSEIEGEISELFRRADDPKFEFTGADKAAMSSFVSLMFARGPAVREFQDTIFSTFVRDQLREWAMDPVRFQEEFQKICEEHKDTSITSEEFRTFVLSPDFGVEQTSAAFRLRRMFELTDDLTPFFYDLNWQKWHTDGTQYFLTSDRPVVAAVRERNSMRFGVGFGVAGVEINFPLSRTTALWMTRNCAESAEFITPSAVRDLNKRIIVSARQFLYAPNKSATVQRLFEKLGGNLKYGENALLQPAMKK